MLEFKTIYFIPDEWEHSETIFEGIIIFNGYNSADFSNKTLLIFPCVKEEKYNFSSVVTCLLKKITSNGTVKVTHISYCKCNGTLEICKNTLMLTKLLNPAQYENKTIKNKINELQNTCHDFDESKFEHLEEYNIENLEKNIFDFDTINKLHNLQCIYFIYGKDKELLYIGKSIRLKTRLKEHFYSSSNTWDISENFKYFNYVIINDKTVLDDYETYFINKLKPTLNVSKVYSYNSNRYDPKYNKKLKDFVDLTHFFRYDLTKKMLEDCYDLSALLKEYEEKQIEKIRKMNTSFEL